MKPRFVYVKSDLESGAKQYDVGILNSDRHHGLVSSVFIIRLGTELEVDESELMDFQIEETGDAWQNKICDRCFKFLNTQSNFSNNRHKKDNVVTRRPSCKSCRKDKDGTSIPTSQRKEWDEKKPANYTLFQCPICNKTTIAGISRIVLDHNHHTGDVRGWICESCNTGIGRFDDDISMVQRALRWLQS